MPISSTSDCHLPAVQVQSGKLSSQQKLSKMALCKQEKVWRQPGDAWELPDQVNALSNPAQDSAQSWKLQVHVPAVLAGPFSCKVRWLEKV